MSKSFKERVVNFWNVFSAEEAEVRNLIDNRAEPETLLSYVGNILAIAFEQPYFEMGRNSEGKYELILTPEGNKAKLFQLLYWLEMSPSGLWEHWNFYASKPGNGSNDFSLQMYDISLSKDDILFSYAINKEQQKIDIEVYSPSLMKLEENQRYNMFFIFLDQFISEMYTMEYIGNIDFVNKQPDDENTVSITDLKSIIEKAIEDNEWFQADSIREKCTGYQMEPSNDDNWALREDIYIGYSSCFPVLSAFYDKSDELFKEFEADGLIYGFLFFKNVDIPKDDLVAFRTNMEEKIMALAEKERAADVIGAATGFYFSYLDFIIYDKDAFLNILKEVLSEYKFDVSGFSNFVFGDSPVLFQY